jgi:HEAT repeat protein
MPTTAQAMAATLAERALADLLYHLTDDRDHVEVDAAVRHIVDHFEVTVDTCDGQRRLILTGQWEIDPAAHMAPLVAAGQR